MNTELHVTMLAGGGLQMEWVDTPDPVDDISLSVQQEIHNRFEGDRGDWLLYTGFCDPAVSLSASLGFWRNVSRMFIVALSRIPDLEALRDAVRVPVDSDGLGELLCNAPIMTGAEYLGMETLKAIWRDLNGVFSRRIADYKGTVEEFFQANSSDIHLVGRVFFHLVENKDGELPFAFLATYSNRLGTQGQSKHLPLRQALQEYGGDSRKLLDLLTAVHRAAAHSPFISDLLESGELFHPLAWTTGDAFIFLQEVPVYESAGILCRIPNWWKGATIGPRLQISVGDTQPSHVGMDAILNFNPRLFLGDTEITEAEARKLLEESEGLAFLKNRWVAADRDKLKQALDAYEKARRMAGEEGIPLREALRFQLNPEKHLKIPAEDGLVTVSNGRWMESVIKKMTHRQELAPVKPGRSFAAELRPYQQKGLDWLWMLHSLKFGACLADDMGLGKTVQLLAFLSALTSNGTADSQPASLLVIPASLIANWVGEIQRFFPRLKYAVAHPGARQNRTVESMSHESLNDYDLIITTYALVQRYEWLQSHSWNYLILDEAQAIKNPGTKQTRAVKTISARNRIIMTGTPVENRLSDLWSLFDFLNPGLLGTSREFSVFSKRLKSSPSGYSRLRKLISPYILRRLKTDKTVISDLPDKVEMKTYAELSKKQVVLYQKLVRDIEKQIDQSDGIQRKGLILAALMKFKQICNHPDQYLGTGEYGEKYSGKFTRLREICETIHEKRERMLVFTQFKEMTEPISAFLESIFGRKGEILHGSIPVGKRKQVIDRFQGPQYVPFMVLSLKAGGVGLNLTEANHVIHFDRWWNPAVENQATDRAFRIGQQKKVVVHKFLTRGTVEEKIDRMLEDKSHLSGEVVATTGEHWITEMDSDAVMDLFTLSL